MASGCWLSGTRTSRYGPPGFGGLGSAVLALLRQDDVFERIAAISGLRRRQVEALHVHQERLRRFVPANRHTHSASTRCCPSCLAQVPAFKKRWMDPLSVVCLVHGVPLIDAPSRTGRLVKTLAFQDYHSERHFCWGSEQLSQTF